jgi:CGNR zinc finger/Putative stress-induced transcription regulator
MVTELKIVGGDPALDLVNTLGDDRVADPLEEYASFAAWAARVGAIDDDDAARLAARACERPAAADRALTEARALREQADAVFRPLASTVERPPSSAAAPLSAAAGEPAPGALARLVARAGAAVERARLTAACGVVRLDSERLVDGGGELAREDGCAFVLAWDGDHLERPLWPLAVSVLDLLRSGPLERLRACVGCPWLFLDTSRNHSRRWCSMDDCGSRSKMRRYRARRARQVDDHLAERDPDV